MKAMNVRPGTKILWDSGEDPRGYKVVTGRLNEPKHVALEFDVGWDDGNWVRFEPDLDLEIVDDQSHPNANTVLAAVYRELRDLLDGDVDASNVWRWTAMRLVKRAAEVLPVAQLATAVDIDRDELVAQHRQAFGPGDCLCRRKPYHTKVELNLDCPQHGARPKDPDSRGEPA